jgi:transposase InsO family protein
VPKGTPMETIARLNQEINGARVVGWSMSAAMTAQLVTDALVMAIWRRGKPDALLQHQIQPAPVRRSDRSPWARRRDKGHARC